MRKRHAASRGSEPGAAGAGAAACSPARTARIFVEDGRLRRAADIRESSTHEVRRTSTFLQPMCSWNTVSDESES